MEFFDCNCSLGITAIPMFRYAANALELEEEMAFCGISRALVYHSAMRFGSPIEGNQWILQETRGRPSLHPTWAILPSQTGEMPPSEALMRAMVANGVRALRAFPNEHRYSLDALTFGDLLEVLQERRIPLFAKQDLQRIGQLLKDFPNLVIVAVNQGPHSLERYLRPLLDVFPKLYVDTSYYISDGLVEEFCARYGPSRLLFGTAYPDNCSGGALLRVAQADIPQASREAIACKNLERILAEVQL
ncbi:MAG: amidohydrolase [Chloroflexi bacterium]|nr:amidohydrolase [Chloroflexota bacterium]